MTGRLTISEQDARAWRPRKGHVWRPMTEAEAREWDRAQEARDRPALLRIKDLCHGRIPYEATPAPKPRRRRFSWEQSRRRKGSY